MKTKNRVSRAAVSKSPLLKLPVTARVLNEMAKPDSTLSKQEQLNHNNKQLFLQKSSSSVNCVPEQVSKDSHPNVGSSMETSGLARQNADDHAGACEYRGGDYPNAGANSIDRCLTAKRCKKSKNGVQEANGDRPDDDDPHSGANSPDRCIAEKRCKKSKNVFKEENTGGPHHVISVDEAQDDNVYGSAPEALRRIDRYRYRPPGSRDKLAVATKEYCFLKSHNTCVLVSLDLEDCVEEKLCIECDRSGRLLICNGNNCPFVVHQSCLGCEASFDSMGNFYCPLCSYKCAVAEYQGAKKALDSAKNALSIFLCMDVAKGLPGCQRQADPSIACREEEAMEEETALDGHAIHISLTKEKDVPAKTLDESQCKIGEEQMQAQCSIANESRVTPTTGEPTHQVGDQESMEGHLQKELSIVYRDDDSSCRENSTALRETTDVPVTKRRRYNQNVFEGQTSRSAAADEMLAKAMNGLETINSPSRDAKNKEDVALEKSRNPHGATRRLANPAAPHLRREKRLWTAEEEEKLKEGVQEFSGIVVKNLPWRKILDYGRQVFDGTRTPTDLKDKWKNILLKEGARERRK